MAQLPPNEIIRAGVPLSDQQVVTIGKIITQWALLDFYIDFEIRWLKSDATIPDELRTKDHGSSFSERLQYLRELAACSLRDFPEGAVEFDREMNKATNLKGKRDWFAHGWFNIRSQNQNAIAVKYKNREFVIGNDKAEELADEISLLAGWLSNFKGRVLAAKAARSNADQT